jgi:SAM-dependent methyltransferase
MDELAKEYVISVFDKKLMAHGDKPDAVGWTQKGQERRFECLLDVADNISGKKILDYGCGKGDFYQFLLDRGIPVRYTGYDINQNLISLAAAKHRECSFSVFDMQADSLGEDFDYIFLCGVFNLNVQGLEETIYAVLRKLFKHCRIALAFNALSVHTPKKSVELHYLSPESIMEFAIRNLSPHVSLIHDRVPYDFTMFVRKEINKKSLL